MFTVYIICCAGHPVVNDPLYNHPVFGPEKGRGGHIGKTEAELVTALIEIHNSDNWIGDDTETSPAEMTRQGDIAIKVRRTNGVLSRKKRKFDNLCSINHQELKLTMQANFFYPRF